MYLLMRKISIDEATPANSATVFPKSTASAASITKNVDRNPNSSRIESESPLPVTTPMRRIALFLAVVGPGVITSNVDNDAGGISDIHADGRPQSATGCCGLLIPLTIALYLSEEMCARMGVVTGKGLSDLIREEFGFRSTFFVMWRR